MDKYSKIVPPLDVFSWWKASEGSRLRCCASAGGRFKETAPPSSRTSLLSTLARLIYSRYQHLPPPTHRPLHFKVMGVQFLDLLLGHHCTLPCGMALFSPGLLKQTKSLNPLLCSPFIAPLYSARFPELLRCYEDKKYLPDFFAIFFNVP